MDDFSQNQNPQDPSASRGGMVSAGSVENPVSIDNSQPNEMQEFGYEKLKQLESATESALEASERKESNMVDDPKRARPQFVKEEKKDAKKKTIDPNAPTYFGYNIPPQVATNYTMISKNKGKGDPSKSQTWVLVLLDRLLKMRNSD